MVELKRICSGKPVYLWGSTHTQKRKIPKSKNRQAFSCSREVPFTFGTVQLREERATWPNLTE